MKINIKIKRDSAFSNKEVAEDIKALVNQLEETFSLDKLDIEVEIIRTV